VETTENVIKSNDVLKTLRQISLIFFFIIGSAHLLSGLMISQNMFLPLTNIVNRVLDIPFAIIGTVFGLSQTRISSDSAFRKPFYIIMIVISLLVLGIMLYINIFLPDKVV